MLDDVMDGWEQGYKAFKIRMDWRSYRQDSNPAKDLQMFKLVRDFLPNNIYLGFDANNGYSVPQRSSKVELSKTTDASTTSRNRSLSTTSPDSAKSLTPSTSRSPPANRTGTAGDSETSSNSATPTSSNPTSSVLSGPSEILKIYTLATTHNKPIMPHSPSAGINSIASIHCYSSIKNATRPHEFSTEFAPPSTTSPNSTANTLSPTTAP